MISKGFVFVVDDDAAVRAGLSMQLQAAGFKVKTYASAEDLLAALRPGLNACLVLDVRLPGMKGPELHTELIRRNINLPIIFLTGYGDIPLAVKSIQAGAVDFLIKPVLGPFLIERINTALQLAKKQCKMEAENKPLLEGLATLTKREREVLALVLEGHSTKEIATHLSISFRTVEHHRSHILLKTHCDNLFKLARLFG